MCQFVPKFVLETKRSIIFDRPYSLQEAKLLIWRKYKDGVYLAKQVDKINLDHNKCV